jgi:hypothetical protein
MNQDKLVFATFFAVVAVVGAIFFGACDQPTASRHALESQGITDVVITGHDFFGCGKEDVSSVGFTGKNPQGHHVKGQVCCGWLKSCTVRW